MEAANNGSRPTPSVSQRYGKESEEIITFEHINLNGINPHDNFVELTNIYGILKTMQAGVYSFNKHNLNTSNQLLMKAFWDKVKFEDKFAKVAISSNQDSKFNNSWQPGGTMIGCAGKWSGRVSSTGIDRMGRWSWLDVLGKKGK